MREIHSPHLGHLWAWSDAPAHYIEAGAWWDQQIRPAIDGVADSQAWAIDLGANIGWFTIYLAGLFQCVLAVEAHPQTFEGLRRNVTERGLANVTLINQAAYDHHTYLTLAPSSHVGFEVTANLDDCASASSVAFGPEIAAHYLPADPLVVPAGPVDDLIPPDAPVALIKCDVQGCDLLALRGLRATIQRCRPRILWEVEHGLLLMHHTTWADYLAFFADLDYTVTRIRADLWDYVSDPKEKA